MVLKELLDLGGAVLDVSLWNALPVGTQKGKRTQCGLFLRAILIIFSVIQSACEFAACLSSLRVVF